MYLRSETNNFTQLKVIGYCKLNPLHPPERSTRFFTHYRVKLLNFHNLFLQHLNKKKSAEIKCFVGFPLSLIIVFPDWCMNHRQD